MTYPDFTLPLAVNKFGLMLDTTRDLFAPVEERSPSDHLRETLAYNAPLAFAISTEKVRWRRMAVATLDTAKHLRDREDYRSCVSRVYYAAYQAATACSVAHGDATSFPVGWSNPTHEQLPDLVGNNGDLPVATRRTVRTILRELRSLREDSDYRPGRTINAQTVKSALLMATTLLERLETYDDDN